MGAAELPAHDPHERRRVDAVPLDGVHGGGVHADEYLVVADLRLGHLAELDCVDTEPLADDRLHLFLPRRHTV